MNLLLIGGHLGTEERRTYYFQSQTRNTRHQKFGIALPKSVVEAKALDETNGNTYIGYWMNALAKAMKNTY